MNHYDAIIIGSGPAGQKAAIASAKMGKKVALIESSGIGGASLHTATIPSKTLREAILELTNYQNKGFYTKEHSFLQREEISISDLKHRINWVKDHLKETLLESLEKNNIEVILGHAKFIDRYHLEILLENGTKKTVKGSIIFLATGSFPRKPKDINYDGVKILTTSDFLSMNKIPKSLIVVGAGVSGCEYASMMCILGVKVTLIDKKKQLLSFLDKEIRAHLEIALEENNLLFIREKEYKKIEVIKDDVCVSFEDGTSLYAEMALITAGREANVSNLDIDKANLTLNKNGYLDVDKSFRTGVSNIYAIGDIIGGPTLASTSYIHGLYAANCAFSKTLCKTMSLYPYGIYTIPEISYIGETEESLQEKNISYEVGRAYFYEISRCVITGNKTGLCKLLFDRKNFTLLGAHIIGRGAAEVIHIAQLAISLNAKIGYFVDHVFNFPTYAEMYAIAARNGMNKVMQSEKKLNEGKKI